MNGTYRDTIVLRIPRSWPLFAGALLINLLLWAALFQLGQWTARPQPSAPIAVRAISEKEWQALHRFAYTQGQRKVVQSDDSPETAVADPFPAEYLGEKTRRVKKETVSRGEDPKGSLDETEMGEKEPAKDVVEKLYASGQRIPISAESPLGRKTANQASKERSAGRRLSMDDLGKSVEMGARTMLNTDEYRFYGFVNRIKESVYPLWRRNLSFYGTQTRVATGQYVIRGTIVMSSGGVFQKIEDWMPSGVSAFDRSVEEAFRDLPRIPNPPKEMIEEDGVLRLKFSFRVDNESSHVIVDYRHGPDDDYPLQAR